MSDHIPHEVVTEILLRLPVKSLLRFRCVSKPWRSLIDHSNFIAMHTKFSIDNTKKSHFLLRHYSRTHPEGYALSLHCDDDSFSLCQEFDFPLNTNPRHFQIVGSCNGLLCLSDYFEVNSQTIVIWNPAIRKVLSLPTPRVSLFGIPNLGFGFDCKSDDYKVVRINFPDVKLYELSKNAWRDIGAMSAECAISQNSPPPFFNCALHWIVCTPNISVMVFNLSDEVFCELKVPSGISNQVMVTVLGEALCLVSYDPVAHRRWMLYDNCSIWVMRDYGASESWAKHFSINLHGGPRLMLGLRENGEILGVTIDGELVSYNPESRVVTYVGIHGIFRSFHLDVYMETLVLLNAHSRVLEEGSS